MAPKISPKKRGRPRKYTTEADTAEAVRQNKLRSYHRRQQRSRQPQGPADFIAYEPGLHSDVPADTLPEIGLRTNIRIPQDFSTQQNNARPPPDPQPNRPATEEDAEISEQIKDIQTKERETDTEQAERDAEIAEILLGMRAAERAEENTGGRELGVLETADAH